MEVTLLDHFGDALTVVNCARVSYGNSKAEFDDEKDGRLLRYLARNQHTSPFRHVQYRFHIRVPEFVARQMYKHVVGIEATSPVPTKDHAWSEISMRYVKIESECFPIEEWRETPGRGQSKQGSGGPCEAVVQERATRLYQQAIETCRRTYGELLEMGVCKEQARAILPLSTYTEFIWTASFQAVVHFIALRDHEHAQAEIRVVARRMRECLHEATPRILAAWESSQ